MTTWLEERNAVKDEEGYLVDPESWTPEIAGQIAGEEGIELGQEHWAVIRFIRDHYAAHQIAVDPRYVIRFLDEAFGYGGKAHNHL